MGHRDGVSETASLAFAALRAPREILFGAGQRTAAGWLTAQHGARAFVCVDPHLIGAPEVREVLASLTAAGVTTTVYSDVVPEVPTDVIGAAARAARAADADVVVALGGGSSIDLAKVVAVLVAHGGRVPDYYGEFRVPGPVLPVVAVPTTSGTGSEVTPVAVVTDTDRGTKVGVSSPHLIPVGAVCDPELTYSCPPAVTAAAGADALAHCVEAYTAVRRSADPDLARSRVFLGRTEITDEFALAGLRHIVGGLATAHRDPGNASARASVMYGALMGGLAFGTAGTAAAHALQYPVGAATGTSHGVGVGVLLPYVMEYNRPHRVPELAQISRIFGMSGADDEELAAAAPGLVAEYLAAVGVPRTLESLGLPEDRIDWAAEQGPAAVRLAENNPEPLTADSARSILRAAWAGDLALVPAPEPLGEDR